MLISKQIYVIEKNGGINGRYRSIGSQSDQNSIVEPSHLFVAPIKIISRLQWIYIGLIHINYQTFYSASWHRNYTLLWTIDKNCFSILNCPVFNLLPHIEMGSHKSSVFRQLCAIQSPQNRVYVGSSSVFRCFNLPSLTLFYHSTFCITFKFSENHSQFYKWSGWCNMMMTSLSSLRPRNTQ